MKLSDLAQRAGEWLRSTGPLHDVVISTRVRLARNLADMPFLPRCSKRQRHDLELRLRGKILECGMAEEALYVDIAKKAQDVRDAYFWVESEETFALSGPLEEIRAAAESAVDEFEKVVRTKRTTAAEVNRVA